MARLISNFLRAMDNNLTRFPLLILVILLLLVFNLFTDWINKPSDIYCYLAIVVFLIDLYILKIIIVKIINYFRPCC